MNLLLFCSSAALLLCLLWFVHSSELVRSGFRRFCVALLSCLLVLVRAAPAYADVATSSNAVLGLTPPEYLLSALSDDADAGIAPASSIGTVTNTVSWTNAQVYAIAATSGSDRYIAKNPSSDGSFKFSDSDYSDVTHFRGFMVRLYASRNLPPAGTYSMEFDFASQFPFTYNRIYFSSSKSITNAASLGGSSNRISATTNAGDIYFKQVVDITNTGYLDVWCFFESDNIAHYLDGKVAVRFTLASDEEPDYTTVGNGSSSDDLQNNIANSTSQIANSVGSMSSDLSSAAESLTYISNSQNLIIQGIDNIILHISDQLYAFWDQLYNLIHEPTYARLGEILAALKAIANNSDISAVIDQIQESTEEQTDAIIANNNANTAKVEEAVEKHGNFIIEGLKSLFIPSDEYFESWFDGMYDFFHDRLGFLMLPIDILIEFIELFQDAGASFSGIPFPEFKWIDGTVIIPAQTVHFTFLETDWGQNIQQKLYFVGDVIMIGALLALMHRKLEGVLRG